MVNKFGKFLDDVHNSEQIPISNEDILKITNGQTNIVYYETLATMTENAFLSLFTKKTNYNIILLYQLDSGCAHWICIILDPQTQQFYHFDPYGSYPDVMLHTDFPYRDLTRLYNNLGIHVNINKYKFQKVSKDVNTCGRWSSIRSVYYYMTNDEFIDYFTKTKPSDLIKNLDHLVTIMTMVPLDYTQDKNEAIDLGEGSIETRP